MKKTSIVFAAVLSLAAVGCKKGGGGDCDQAIAHSMELSKASMAKMPGVDDKMMGKMRDVAVKSCKDDKWSPEVVKCMTDAKAEADSQTCYGKLTSDQQTKMNKAAMELMSPPAPAGAGSAAAGSADTGSAAAGSAAPK